ncbi:hypothetical protein HPB50_017467 [Hyalomma asiaticum]|uniref:Uncharacterized protein n=1 Tax=Hyalomma asiaticum TaxID=266040 RepID=A0ACB7RJQ9_HYAAI|nr:hypothetical protein HPB50_017467 [Hyalomma asiaticum]
MSSNVEKFWNAKQNAGEEVRSFAERLRIFGKATLGIVSGEDPAKTQLRREILEEELLSRFTAGLRDPVRRFVLSHEPRTFEEAVEVAAREEQIDKLCTRSIHHGSDSAEERELLDRLDRLEKLIERSLGLPEYERDADVRRRCSTAPPPRCCDCGRFGHVARECVRRQLDPRNESPDCQSTDIKSVEEAVAGRLEKNRVAGHGEEKALVTTVDICGEDVALEPVSDELEASVMQWQVEMLASDEYGGESGDEVSSSCETPQMPTPREKGSERDEVGEKPLEVMSESVAEIAPREDEVVLDSPEEAREEIPHDEPHSRHGPGVSPTSLSHRGSSAILLRAPRRDDKRSSVDYDDAPFVIVERRSCAQGGAAVPTTSCRCTPVPHAGRSVRAGPLKRLWDAV